MSRVRNRIGLGLLAASFAFLVGTVLYALWAERRTLPDPDDAQLVARGKPVYDRHCASCHGKTGKGIGTLPDLSDARYMAGRTDAQLLEKIGLKVREIYLYDVCAFKDTSQWNEFRELFSNNKVDGIIFTSASSVNAFFEIMLMDSDEKKLLQDLQRIKVVAIGPFTADELKKFGTNYIIADVHTVLGAFETVKNCFN